MTSRTVFVTGATGFVGRQAVETLVEQGHAVRALVRRRDVGLPSPVVTVLGDLARRESYAEALQGADAVLHAGLTENFSGDVQMTRDLFAAAAAAGVRTFVHLSSIAIYGTPASGHITESFVPVTSSDPYAIGKRAIEEALQAASGIPETVILRLGCVYGPGSGWWTHGLLSLMRRGRLLLIDDGHGMANLVHVRDVAALIGLVLTRPHGRYDAFNVTDGQPIEWRVYLAALEQIHGGVATAAMTSDAARVYSRKWLRPSLWRRAWRKAIGTRFVFPLEEAGIAGYASRAVYSNERAVTVFGFSPLYDLARGLTTLDVHTLPVRR